MKTKNDLAPPHKRAVEMADPALEGRVDRLLRELLQPQNNGRLQSFRFHGSTNRVYRIPLDVNGNDFIIVKLLPSLWVTLKKRTKRSIRNMLYGEHDISTGGQRVQMEIERAREWGKEGFSTPLLIETTIPGVRVFKGLEYPTFYTILTNKTYAPLLKLKVLAAVTRDLSSQHRVAWQKGKKGLVHKDPGPWNVMFDLERGVPYWFDLEYPAEYPGMTLEALMARAIRIFIFGVLEHLEDQFDEVIETFTENYQIDSVLWRFIGNMERPRTYLANRIVATLRNRRNGAYLLRSRIAPKMRSCLGKKRTSISGATKFQTKSGR